MLTHATINEQSFWMRLPLDLVEYTSKDCDDQYVIGPLSHRSREAMVDAKVVPIHASPLPSRRTRRSSELELQASRPDSASAVTRGSCHRCEFAGERARDLTRPGCELPNSNRFTASVRNDCSRGLPMVADCCYQSLACSDGGLGSQS